MNGPVDPERTLRSKLIGDSFRCSQLVAELSKQILPPCDVILALDPPADQGLVDFFDGLDEMCLSEDEIRRVRLVDPDVAACPSPCARDGRLSQFFNELLPTRWEIVPHLPILPETLRAIGPRIPRSLALILPNIPLHVVAFGCTSATIMTLGEGTF
jgi:hypothetical protein